jgi:transcriptional regulator with XRE-family HTH domain
MTSIPRRPASVAIDGDRVRQIREEKGLTQLYVAEVVRVSVDTVSRWENKRTQAIRVENAAALAAALEVPLEEITLGADPGVAPGLSRRVPTWAWPSIAVLALLGVAVLGWALLRPDSPVLSATRRLPAYTAPGTNVPVVVRVRVMSGEVARVVLREQLPPGWQFVGAVPTQDQGPDASGALRWIVPVTDRHASVAYVVRPPAGAAEGTAHRFGGEVVTPGKSGRHVPVRGESRIDLEYIYWADEDGDFQVGDGEVLDALERIEAVPNLGVGSDGLRALWGADEYRWDPEVLEFTPVP